MPTLNDVLAGSQAQAVQVQQIIDALKGTPNKGVPVALVSLNDTNNYALTVQNDDPTNSRALSVLKADGTTLISADATGVTLGSPINAGTGSISGTALANASVTNAKLASDTARSNLLTNGGVEVWQRGSGPFTASLVQTSDRWQFNDGAGSTHSISKDTANIDAGSGACAAVTYTHAATSQFLSYATDLTAQFIGRPISFSVRVRTSTASAVRATCTVVGATGTATGTLHTGGGTYQTLVVTTTPGAGATQVVVGLDFLASCTAYVDNAMLVIGSQYADYAPMHPADELARCLRYYEILGETASEMYVVGYAATGVTDTRFYGFKARKAVTPTVTKVGTWSLTNCAQPSINTSGVTGVSVGSLVSATGAFNYNNSPATTYITSESNV